MLSGIRTGKKRKRSKKEQSGGNRSDARNKEGENDRKASSYSSAGMDNEAAAEELRRLFSRGGGAAAAATTTTNQSVSTSNQSSHTLTSTSVLNNLEKRGRISSSSQDDNNNDDPTKIVLTGEAAATTSSTTITSIHTAADYRHGSRKGKIKPSQATATLQKDEESMTIEQMLQQEKNSSQTNTMSMDEQYARNISKLGSRFKNKDFASTSKSGADEEDFDNVDTSLFSTTTSSSKLTKLEAAKRERSRQIAHHEKSLSITSKCWWWMESPSFEKHRLLALGDYLTLVLTPSNLALVPHQCYLVPVQHCESFVSADEQVWEELVRFQSSLRQMFASIKKGVLFSETVLPSKGGGRGSLWQARMDVIPVPKKVELDAELYFKSSMMELSEEWGTHNKVMRVTKDGNLKKCIPKNGGFSYFYVEWGSGNDGGGASGAATKGFCQIIESEQFPKDFGLDTVASMMEMDPVRFNRRKKRASDGDRSVVLEFCEMWKGFDWTLELDGAGK